MYKSLAIVFAVLCSIILMPNTSAQASSDRCFAETGFCISGRIRSYWELNGGLPVFGFPTSNLRETDIEGKPFMAQNFERNRLELHPENKAPYDVLIGRVGALNLTAIEQEYGILVSGIVAIDDYDTKAYDDGTLHKNSPAAKWFPQTKFFVSGYFLDYWKTHGLQLDGKKSISEAESLALFGLPLTRRFMIELDNGSSYEVQIFERARFEYHPENPEPYKVLLGLLGNEFLPK